MTHRLADVLHAELVLPRLNGQVVKPPAYTTIDTINRQKRRFTTEQKTEAVGLCLSENLSILEASKRLGVHASCLGRWVKPVQIDQGGLKDSGPLTSDERIEFSRLRKEKTRTIFTPVPHGPTLHPRPQHPQHCPHPLADGPIHPGPAPRHPADEAGRV